jgi:hypothetical protein
VRQDIQADEVTERIANETGLAALSDVLSLFRGNQVVHRVAIARLCDMTMFKNLGQVVGKVIHFLVFSAFGQEVISKKLVED